MKSQVSSIALMTVDSSGGIQALSITKVCSRGASETGDNEDGKKGRIINDLPNVSIPGASGSLVRFLNVPFDNNGSRR
jgi:hypothetical protein